MVSLKERYDYSLRVSESPKLATFYDLLFNKNTETDSVIGSATSDDIYFGIIKALKGKNRESFEKLFLIKSKSRPNKDSIAPFVNDDFLIFALLVGVMKYALNKEWLIYILSIRGDSPITATFKNILNGDLDSHMNLPEVILIYLHIVYPDSINERFLTRTYEAITKAPYQLFNSQNDFQIICALRSFDLIVLERRPFDIEEYETLQIFNAMFKRRTRWVAYIIQTGLLFILLWGLLMLPLNSINFLNQNAYIFSILGALGITILTDKINLLKGQTQILIMRMLGYPRSFLRKSSKALSEGSRRKNQKT